MCEMDTYYGDWGVEGAMTDARAERTGRNWR